MIPFWSAKEDTEMKRFKLFPENDGTYQGKYYVYDTDIRTMASRSLDLKEAEEFAEKLNAINETGTDQEKREYQIEEGLFW